MDIRKETAYRLELSHGELTEIRYGLYLSLGAIEERVTTEALESNNTYQYIRKLYQAIVEVMN